MHLRAVSHAHASFVSPQVMIHERQLFNPATNDFTVESYLDGLQQRYGGIDSVLLWQSYPNMGIDNRNQVSAQQLAGYYGAPATSLVVNSPV